jgi:hypothetical protein
VDGRPLKESLQQDLSKYLSWCRDVGLISGQADVGNVHAEGLTDREVRNASILLKGDLVEEARCNRYYRRTQL